MSKLNERLTDWVNLQNLLTIEVTTVVGNLKFYDDSVDVDSVKRALYAIAVTGTIDLPNGVDNDKFKTVAKEHDETVEKVLHVIAVRFNLILSDALLESFRLKDKSGEEILTVLISDDLYKFLRTTND